MFWWVQDRFADVVVKDCENENTCSPSMWVTNSGKKRCSL